MDFQLIVIGFAALFDGKTEQDQTGLTQALGKRLFCQCATQTPVAVFKGVDAFEPHMAEPGPGQSGEREGPLGAVSLNHDMNRCISSGTCTDGGASK